MTAVEELRERPGQRRRRQLEREIEAAIGDPVDRVVKGVVRPIPGLLIGVFLLVVLVAGILAPLLAPSGLWFVALAALGGAAVGLLAFALLPRLTSRHRPAVVAVAGEQVVVHELTAARRVGVRVASGDRGDIERRPLPAFRRWTEGMRGDIVVVDSVEIGLRRRLEL